MHSIYFPGGWPITAYIAFALFTALLLPDVAERPVRVVRHRPPRAPTSPGAGRLASMIRVSLTGYMVAGGGAEPWPIGT